MTQLSPALTKEQEFRLSSIGLLSAALAHEVRNTLSGITTLAQALESDVALELKDDIKSLSSAALRLEPLIQQVLRFAQVPQSPRQPSAPKPLGDVIKDAARFAALHPDSHNITLHNQLRAVETEVAQPELLEIICINLFTNAMQATPRSGDIWAQNYNDQTQGYLSFEVADNGPGLSPQIQSALFTAFATDKPKGQGIGLGLFLSKWQSEALGGKLELIRSDEQGTVFQIVWPTKKPK